MELLRESLSRLNVTTPTVTIVICLIGVAVPVFIWDLRQYRIPNGVTVTFLLICSLVIIIHEHPAVHIVPSRMIVGGVVPLAVRRFTCNGIGLGDVRLSAGIAVLLGIQVWGIAVLIASFLALLCFVMIGKLNDSEAGLPFGPFLVSGAILSTVAPWW